MQTFIGTFGTGHELAKFYQPLHAENESEACSLMLRRHGNRWAFMYSLQEYKRLQDEGFFVGHSPLQCLGGNPL